MVGTLLALLLVAGLAMYLFHAGRRAQAREFARASAAAAANNGASWVARALNTVAMNNRAMADMIMQVAIIDSLPLAAENATANYQAMRDALTRLDEGKIPANWTIHTEPTHQYSSQAVNVAVALRSWQDRIRMTIEQIDRIPREATDDGPASDAGTASESRQSGTLVDYRAATHFHPPGSPGTPGTPDTPDAQGGQRGRLWRAMSMLEDYSHAQMENLAVMAQLSAIRGGMLNTSEESQAIKSYLLPVRTEVPWRFGQFEDFKRLTNRRLRLFDPTEDDRFDGGLMGRSGGGALGDPLAAAQGKVPISEGVAPAGGGGHRDDATIVSQVTALQAKVNQLASGIDYAVGADRSLQYELHKVASVKMDYLWGNRTERSVARPRWVTGIDRALSAADADPRQVREVMYVVASIKSRYSSTDPKFMSRGSWQFVQYGQPTVRTIDCADGWNDRVDPRAWVRGGLAESVGDGIFRDEWSYEVAGDRSIGVTRTFDAARKPLPARVYRIDDYVFVGVNFATDVPVRNPFNMTRTDRLPLPVVLDDRRPIGDDDLDDTYVEAGSSQSLRRRMTDGSFLTLLAVSVHEDRSPLWSLFAGDAEIAAVYGATVINQRRPSLWSQMWESHTVPTDDYARWIDHLSRTKDHNLVAPLVMPEQWAGVRESLIRHAADPKPEQSP